MTYRFGQFELDDRLYSLCRQGERVPVRNKVLDLLFVLVRHRDRVIGKSELLERLWPGTAVTKTSLTTAINAARVAVGDTGRQQRIIETCFGRGYRFVAHVEEVDEATSSNPGGIVRDLFVGRQDTLRALEEALRGAILGDPRVFLIAGEMGIGKSRVAERLADLARHHGVRVCVGRCEAESATPSYWPWTQVLRRLCDGRTAVHLESLLGAGAPELARLIPGLSDRLGGTQTAASLEGTQERFRLFDSVARFLGNCAAESPILLVLEDLHRADEGSLLLLRFLARRMSDQALLIVGTHRDTSLRPDAAQTRRLGELVREPLVRRVELGPLSPADVSQYLVRAAGASVPENVCGAFYERTGGNPFFLSQLVILALSSQGPAGLTDGVTRLPALPADLTNAITRQLDCLSTECSDLLGVASVMGRDIHPPILSRAADCELETVAGFLRDAFDAGIVTGHPERPSHFRFSHIIVRDVLYNRLPVLVRRRLHDRVGSAIEHVHGADLGPYLSELAFHYAEAAPTHDPKRALHYSERAALQASRSTGHEEAAGHYLRALALLELIEPIDDEQRCDLLIALAHVYFCSGHRPEARAVIDRAAEIARALNDPARLAEAALTLEPGFLAIEVGVVDQALVDLLNEAIQSIPSERDDLRIRLVARLAAALYWTESKGQLDALVTRETEATTTPSDPKARIYALSTRLWSLWAPECLRTRLDVANELVSLADLTDREGSLLARLFLISSLLEAGEISRVDREIVVFRRIAATLRQPQSLWYGGLFSAMRALLVGRFDEAEVFGHDFLRVAAPTEDVNAAQSFGADMALLQLERGQFASLERAIDGAMHLYPGNRIWRSARPLVYFEAGKLREAQRDLDELATSSFDDFARDATWLICMVFHAEACVLGSNEDCARRLYDHLSPFCRQFAIVGFGTICWGSVARQLGALASMLGEWDESDAHFELALEKNAGIGAWPSVAHTQHDYAHMLMRRNQPGDLGHAEELAAGALETARQLGMKRLEGKLARLR